MVSRPYVRQVRDLHHGSVFQVVQVPERRPTLYGVLLLGPVQEQGTDDSIPHYSERPARALHVRRVSARSWPACLTPACLVTNTIVLTRDIDSWGRERRWEGRRGRMQEPEGRQRWGQSSWGKIQGQKGSKAKQGRGGG